MTTHEHFMHRCLMLASQSAGYVAPNPMVGAVLVSEGRIIGEGYHQRFGGPHAEISCLDSVAPEHRHLISGATMYVSLEPCAHHGKTPPCAERIIREKISTVVVGCRDPFVQVDGRGIEALLRAGVEVIEGVLRDDCRQLNRRFLTFHEQQRPYVILKWAQTADGMIGRYAGERLKISGAMADRLVHRWRSEEAAIAVGTNTALFDDPKLTNRLWPGPSPVRVIVDMRLRLPRTLHVFDGSVRTIVFNGEQHADIDGVEYRLLDDGDELSRSILRALFQMNLQSVLIEGGTRLLQTFINSRQWDEVRVITNTKMFAREGMPAPIFRPGPAVVRETCGDDVIDFCFSDGTDR